MLSKKLVVETLLPMILYCDTKVVVNMTCNLVDYDKLRYSRTLTRISFVSVFVCWQFWIKIPIIFLLCQSLQILPWTLVFSKVFVIEDC